MNAEITIRRPQRWDNPFDPEMSEADVDRIVAQDLFRDMDTS